MFIGQKYYNEVNISTIEYEVITTMKDFEVRKIRNIQEMEDEYWVLDLSSNMLTCELDGEQKKSFKVIDEEDITDAEKKAKDIRYNYEINKNSRYGPNKYEVQKVEDNVKYLYDIFKIQSDIMSRNKIGDYIFNEGWITVFITMNNGEKFEEKLLYWCDKEGQKDSKVIKIDEKSRQYQDEEVDIKFVYRVLNGYKPKIKSKEYI